MPKNIQLPQKGAAKLDIRLHETLLKFKDPYSLSSFFSIQTVENRKPIILVLRRSQIFDPRLPLDKLVVVQAGSILRNSLRQKTLV